MASFSFSFSGDDIENEAESVLNEGQDFATVASARPLRQPPAPAASAFPVQGKPQLPAQRHELRDMLARLPSKIAYSLFDVVLDSSSTASNSAGEASSRIRLPRRELWDVKVQLMAEDDVDELAAGLGAHDVKTGIYEGGFKSWESSADLVKVLLQPPAPAASSSAPSLSTVAATVLLEGEPAHVIELGCGTALPSLALFHWACATSASGTAASPAYRSQPLSITVSDYNPSVLYLVTLPNFILTWALKQWASIPLLQQALSKESDGEPTNGANGELELNDDVKDAFCAFLTSAGISLSFLSGGWSAEFVELLYAGSTINVKTNALVLAAETIYSPFALEAFSEVLLAILRRERGLGDATSATAAVAIVGAKKLYFGVGGSLDDFIRRMRNAGATVHELREETDGVRRGVVRCLLE